VKMMSNGKKNFYIYTLYFQQVRMA